MFSKFALLLKLLPLFIFIFWLSGCASIKFPPTPIPSAATLSKYPLRGKKATARIPNLSKYNTAVVTFMKIENIDEDVPQNMKNFWLNAIKNLGIFQHVLTPEELPNFLKSHHIYTRQKYFASLYDLRILAESFDKFLVMVIFSDCSDYNLKQTAECSVSLTLLNPKTKKLYFRADNTGNIGNTKQLQYPLLNALNQWLKHNQK